MNLVHFVTIMYLIQLRDFLFQKNKLVEDQNLSLVKVFEQDDDAVRHEELCPSGSVLDKLNDLTD